MNALLGAAEAQPLLQALHDLIAAYQEARTRAENLVAALASGDSTAMQAAITAQTAVLSTIDGAEQRRRAAEAVLAGALSARQPGEARRTTVTSSELLTILPPDEATQLRDLRHELLTILVHVQSTNRQAAMLLRNAQAVINRVLNARTPQTVGYGPRGEPALLTHDGHRPAIRLA